MQTNISPLVVYLDSPRRNKHNNDYNDSFGPDGKESGTEHHDSGTLGSPDSKPEISRKELAAKKGGANSSKRRGHKQDKVTAEAKEFLDDFLKFNSDHQSIFVSERLIHGASGKASVASGTERDPDPGLQRWSLASLPDGSHRGS
jgi:hypothetical protein